jgi:hypothetical protein
MVTTFLISAEALAAVPTAERAKTRRDAARIQRAANDDMC